MFTNVIEYVICLHLAIIPINGRVYKPDHADRIALLETELTEVKYK